MTYDHYSEYDTDVDKKVEDVKTKIEEGVRHIWDKWDESIASSNWLWLSPAAKIASEIAKGNIEDEVKRLWDEFKEVCDDMWEKVQEMTGDPWELMEMNAAYIDAAGRIRDEKTVIDGLTSEVSKHWEGVAYTAYTATATKQRLAINAVDKGLVKAATACAEGALQIRSIWRDMIDALLDVVDTVLDGIKDGTDAGQWVTFDAGPAIKVIGKMITEALRLWNKLDRYFDDNATVKLSMWRDLNSGLDGLDANNDWPVISSRDSSDMDDKGNWTQK